jgi:adenosylcobinamide-phosphate synthase
MQRSSASTKRSNMVEPIAALAIALDVAVGWPPALYARIGHPVGGFARLIGGAEKSWNRPLWSASARRFAGLLTIVFVVGIAIGASLIATALAHLLFGQASWIAIAVMAAPGLAMRSLHDHVKPVAHALERNDLDAARTCVSMIVGRDVTALDQSGVARAAVESLAESVCDGVVAPLFWLLVAGLPGIWAYKAINTADSLIGHREDRWRAFGWAAARTDDLANLIPARISGVALCLAGGGGWRTMMRDARNHASPNAGWPEAAMAGVLGVQLAGPIAYDGIVADKPYIGSGNRDLGARDIWLALRVYRGTCILLLVIAGLIAWLR